MPKTNNKFDWEIFDENDEFLDILTMTRDESKEFLKSHPTYSLKEIEYNDRGNISWNSNRETNRNLYKICISDRRQRIKNVYKNT